MVWKAFWFFREPGGWAAVGVSASLHCCTIGESDGNIRQRHGEQRTIGRRRSERRALRKRFLPNEFHSYKSSLARDTLKNMVPVW